MAKMAKMVFLAHKEIQARSGQRGRKEMLEQQGPQVRQGRLALLG
jgi:hypothetical protein